MEKKFEKPSDRIREKETLDIFFEDKDCSFIQSDEFSKNDAKIISKELEVIGFCEVKTMFKNVEDTDYVRIGLRKICSSQEKSILQDTPFLFIWRFNNAIGSVWLQNVKGKVEWGGRKVPREGSYFDRELMLYINKDCLTIIDAKKL
tara:strand:- start:7279 stop:7719 length:441 start_codon:yes stop_codon:yes gene_type:complete